MMCCPKTTSLFSKSSPQSLTNTVIMGKHQETIIFHQNIKHSIKTETKATEEMWHEVTHWMDWTAGGADTAVTSLEELVRIPDMVHQSSCSVFLNHWQDGDVERTSEGFSASEMSQTPKTSSCESPWGLKHLMVPTKKSLWGAWRELGWTDGDHSFTLVLVSFLCLMTD